MRSFWPLAFHNLLRNRRRNVATAFTLLFGYAGFVLLGGYILRIGKYLEVNSVYLNHSGYVSIYKRGGLDRHLSDPRKFNLTEAERLKILEELKGDPEVEFVGAYLHGTGLLSNGCSSTPFLGTGIDPEVEKRIRSHPVVRERVPELVKFAKGQGLWEYPAASGPISVTAGLAELVGKPLVRDEVVAQTSSSDPMDCASPSSAETIRKDAAVQLIANSFSGDFAAADATVVSHHQSGFALMEDTDLVAPLALLQKLYATSSVTYLAVFLKDSTKTAAFRKDLEGRLARLGLETDLYAFNDARVNLYFVGAMNFMYVMDAFFLLLVCGVVALSIINTLGMTVLERMPELGTMRAVGFARTRIAGIFAQEALLLALISLSIAAPVTFQVASMINSAQIRFTVPGLAGDLQFMLLPNWQLGTVTLIGLAAVACATSYFVALSLMKRRIGDLLHGVTA